MKPKRNLAERITDALKQVEAGTKLAQVARHLG